MSAGDSSPSRLAAAISSVMAEATAVGKDRRNDFHGYDYASADNVKTVIQPIMAKHGLALVRVGKPEISRAPYKTSRGKDAVLLQLMQEYVLIHGPSGERQPGIFFYGEGSDSEDKAYQKAHTAMYKYGLIDLFVLPMGGRDPEADDADRARDPEPESARLPMREERPPAGPRDAAVGAVKRLAGELSKRYDVGPGKVLGFGALVCGVVSGEIVPSITEVPAEWTYEQVVAIGKWLRAQQSAWACVDQVNAAVPGLGDKQLSVYLEGIGLGVTEVAHMTTEQALGFVEGVRRGIEDAKRASTATPAGGGK